MIVVGGEALIDLVVAGDGQAVAVPGGGPFNAARTIGRLGVDVSFLGALSDDRFGAMLRDRLLADGVDLGMAVSTDHPTTLAVAELDERGAAAYRFYLEGTSAPELHARVSDPAALAATTALHVGTLGLVLEPMASTLEDIVLASPAEAVVLVDANCRPGAVSDHSRYLDRLHRTMERADVIKVSADDLAYLGPARDPLRTAFDLAHRHDSVVLFTDGPAAVHCIAPAWQAIVPAPQVEVVDTIGAGDAFGASFLAGWIEAGLGRSDLRDRDQVVHLVRFACQVAAITCQRSGADPPRAAELGTWPVHRLQPAS